MEVDLRLVALCAVLGGVVSHLLWFKHGEHLLYAPLYFVLAIFGPSIVTATLWHYFSFTSIQAIVITAVGSICYLVALSSSIAIYRLYLHPLRSFPGPPWARLTEFWHVRKVAAKCDNFRYLDSLHTEYGEYVRVGPNLLSISDPDWVEPIHNPQSKFEKADWYSQGHPMTTLHQMRDRAMHDRRRRHGWDKAFTTKSLRAYDSRLLKYADNLVNQIKKRSGKAVSATSWTNYFAYDVMG
jgi:tryprostatin B 6-hydroxylase